MLILDSRLKNIDEELQIYHWYLSQDNIRKGALIELCYNLGLEGLLKFDNFLQFMYNKDYPKAISDLKQTKWATQVGEERVNDICQRIEKGSY